MNSGSPLPFEQLPRLLYLGDVPVESSYHGSALIYRLLQTYPPEKLRIIEGNLRNSLPERRLAGVSYSSVKVGWKRPLYTRFTRWANLTYSYAAHWKMRAVRRTLGNFHPEAVLTVAHDFLWLTAASYARQHSLPLHLICHDDWPRLAPVPSTFNGWPERQFGKVYRQAISRLCVSPYMAEEYERRYGAKGAVLYPSRAFDTPVFDAAKRQDGAFNRPFTVAYAGSLATRDYVRQLVIISRLLPELNGRLLLFGPFDATLLQGAGMNLSSVVAGGLLSSAELVRRLHRDADVLFLPMSFVTSELDAMALNFPSKLTDYTAAGLPLVIWGPESCSAAKWAASEPGVAAVLTDPEPGAMALILKRLKENAAWCSELAKTSVMIGKKYFAPRVADELFFSSLTHSKSENTGAVENHATGITV
jgi:glycosyltransferase involved in cell wall biosynthesis